MISSLREEAGERREAGDGEAADRKQAQTIGMRPAQAAHRPHVLLAVQRVDDDAGGEEEAAP